MGNRARIRVVVPCLLVLMTLLAGCGGSAAQNSGTPTASNGGNTPTTSKSKPTGFFTIDNAFCNKIVTLSEASSIMGATATIERTSPGSTDPSAGGKAGGSCNYEVKPYHAAVFIAFFPFSSSASISTIASAMTANPDFKGKISSIDGLGDKAQFVVNPLPAPLNIVQYHLMIQYGSVLMDVVNPGTNGVQDNSKALDQLKQVAQLALGRM